MAKMTTDREAMVKLLSEIKEVFAGDALPHWQLQYETTLMRGHWLDRIDSTLSAQGGEQTADTVSVPRERMRHWLEYWNGSSNEKAMGDALDFLLSEFESLLAAAKEGKS